MKMVQSSRSTENRGQGPLAEKQMHLDQAHAINNEAANACRRMVGIVEETKAVGIDTIDQLVQQGEQLDNIEGNLDTMQFDIRKSEHHIEEMEKCCGVFTLPWKRWKRWNNTKAYKEVFDAKEKKAKKEKKVEEVKQADVGGRYVETILGDAQEVEMNDDLNQVGQGIDILKRMAEDMGETIAVQDKQLDRIHDKGEVMEIGIARNHNRVEKMLR